MALQVCNPAKNIVQTTRQVAVTHVSHVVLLTQVQSIHCIAGALAVGEHLPDNQITMISFLRCSPTLILRLVI